MLSLNPSVPKSHAHLQTGVALVIVLGFIVLLTSVIVAFFSRSMADRQISIAGANQVKVELFALGALDQTLSDLRQEIVDSSSSTSISNATIYTPATAYNMKPSLAGFTANAAPKNVLKRSAWGQPFYSGTGFSVTGTSRAAQLSSTSASINGRFIPLARWNAPLLLPKGNPADYADLTPITTGSFAFSAPDWILMARDGSNPVVWNSNMRWSETASTSVIARYAYVIYDEGGLLDLNVAGYPVATNGAMATYKSGITYADLKQIPGIDALTASQQNNLIDNIVGWRNYASANASGSMGTLFTTGYAISSGSAYNTYVLSDTTGFLNVTGTLNNGQSDRRFVSRQQLIQFFLQGLGGESAVATAERAKLQNALQYLGTFSRDINQPSYFRNASAPNVVGPYTPSSALSTGSVFPGTAGGNDAYGLDDPINPSFLNIRVTSVFNRNDGSQSVIGEPLVKKRFPLNLLCWITYKGPSADLASNDAIVTDLTARGISAALIKNGTKDNIKAYFGLTWDSLNKLWVYSHDAPGGGIAKLGEVQSLNREADFFELLKAGMVLGSLAKGAATNHGTSGINEVDISQYALDTSVNSHIIQIGANMIDQFDMDSYPTHIEFGGRDFFGVENLPYIYRARVAGIPVSSTNGVMLLLPEVWNPHDPNGAAGNPAPTNFRFILAGESTTTIAAFAETRMYDLNGSLLARQDSSSGPTTSIDSPMSPTGLTALNFTVQASSTACQQPVFLGNLKGSSQASSISLSVPASNTLRSYGDTEGYVKDTVSGLSYCGVLLGQFPLTWKTTYLNGVSQASLDNIIATATNGSTKTYTLPLPSPPNSSKNPSTADLCSTASIYQVDYILQYDDGGTWRTYQCNYSTIPKIGSCSVAAGGAPVNFDISSNRCDTAWIGWMDPRTSRFNGGVSLYRRLGGTVTAGPTTISTQATYCYGKSSRPGTDFGEGLTQSIPASGLGSDPSNTSGGPQIGWYPGKWTVTGVNDGSLLFIPGFYAENIPTQRLSPQNTAYYFTDADGVVRRGMGAYVPAAPTNTVGMPLADANSLSRPLILNRPFRSVGELGYVFSGTPWRNLDFSNPESGAVPLLDVFCVNDTNDSEGLVAGKVNLNTRNAPVIQALLSGHNLQDYAYKDEVHAGQSGVTYSLNQMEVSAIAAALVARTTSTAPTSVSGQGLLSNLSELVGKWNSKVLIPSAVAPHNIDGSQSYVGFSSDLTAIFTASDTTLSTAQIQRLRESAVRALAACGQTRVWNLMIDLVAQTGRYLPTGTALDQFTVDGERRYWLHVAMDRYTGKILDLQLELVKE